ncbi:transglycosylase SLT domain-containing protein [Brumimicrobium sp.]|uniref:transglycosylase SLT domain-containing protein n=1 Tax=Brumimicrobium sp. TaxID=2029867 RepID=UPI003A907E98
MLKTIITTITCAWIGVSCAHEIDSLENTNKGIAPTVNLVESRFLNDTVNLHYVSNIQLFEQEWDHLAHPVFWKTIMTLSPDSCVINIGATREIVEVTSLDQWDLRTDEEKDAYRDSIRVSRGLDSEAKVYMTTGKKDFYAFDHVLPTISRGVEVFKEQNVDPWYAQAILMIESPGRLAKSNAGAYGSFQLMAGVARAQGLTVNRYVDERKDFEKSAIGASRLISRVCIPEAKVILDRHGIAYHENDLWFRLFVMHIYHAGAANVSGVVNKINPITGGMDLIQAMWVTENGRFRNASQNYTQIALAAMLIFEEMIWDC